MREETAMLIIKLSHPHLIQQPVVGKEPSFSKVKVVNKLKNVILK